MAVVREFTLPDLGEGLTEAEIVRWLVEVGEVVAVDQPVVEVETAKAVVEVPCPYGGVVTARFGAEGESLAVGRPLVTVAVGSGSVGGGADGVGGAGGFDGAGSFDGAGVAGGGSGAAGAGAAVGLRGAGGSGGPDGPGDGSPDSGGAGREGAASGTAGSGGSGSDGAGSGGSGSDGAGSGAAGSDDAGGGRAREDGAGRSGSVLVGYGTVTATARRRGRVRAVGAAAGGRDGTVVAGTRPADGPVAVISPLVRRLAREHGVDLRTLTGSGRDGLILRSDVEQAAAGVVSAPGPQAPSDGSVAAPGGAEQVQSAGPAAPVGAERVPLRGIRGAVAEKLSRSRREIPDATCWVDADATELLAVRAAMNASGGPRISVLALLARVTTAALGRHPELNSTVDTGRGEIVRLPSVHLGFAAQTERGLVVPVVRDAQTRTTAALSAEIARLTEAARKGTLTPAELTGGTFTLNNYGVFGVDGSTPIINHPEAAMLGVGRIAAKPWVHQGELAVRQVVQLSFTFDHRVCDGGAAGGFLRFVADCVENPAVLLAAV